MLRNHSILKITISSQNQHVLGIIHEIKCNECDKNNYIDFDGQTKQKPTTRIKDQAHFITNQKGKSTIFVRHCCESVHYYFINNFT